MTNEIQKWLADIENEALAVLALRDLVGMRLELARERDAADVARDAAQVAASLAADNAADDPEAYQTAADALLAATAAKETAHRRFNFADSAASLIVQQSAYIAHREEIKANLAAVLG